MRRRQDGFGMWAQWTSKKTDQKEKEQQQAPVSYFSTSSEDEDILERMGSLAAIISSAQRSPEPELEDEKNKKAISYFSTSSEDEDTGWMDKYTEEKNQNQNQEEIPKKEERFTQRHSYRQEEEEEEFVYRREEEFEFEEDFVSYNENVTDSNEPIDHPIFLTRKAELFINDRLANDFIPAFKIGKMSSWQENFFILPPQLQAGHILAALPGQGKTLFAQWATVCATSSYCMHTSDNYRDKRNKKIVLWGVPLRMLARQVGESFEKWYGSKRWSEETGKFEVVKGIGEFSVLNKNFVPPVKIIEGTGANTDIRHRRVVICTYEHLLNLLHRFDEPMYPNTNIAVTIGQMISLVVVDEVHEITKPDRGIIVDEILLLCHTLKLRVLAMSGTMPHWALWRLTRAYPSLFHTIIKPQQERFHEIFRVFLKTGDQVEQQVVNKKTRTTTTKKAYITFKMFDFIPILTPICLNAFQGNGRFVVFCGSKKGVEETFLYLSGIFFAYLDDLGDGSILDILNKFSRDEDFDRIPFTLAKPENETFLEEKLKEHPEYFRYGGKQLDYKTVRRFMEYCIVEGYVLLHHASIGSTNQLVSPKSIIEHTLGEGFMVCVATTTVAVGVNLAPVSHVFLGPSHVWTADQGEQMIGRCGRSMAGYAVIVKSKRLTTPGLSAGFSFKKEIFLSRFISMCYMKDTINRLNLPEQEEENPKQVEEVYSYSGEIRGFYHPMDVEQFPSPGFSVSLNDYAIAHGYIDTQFNVSPLVKPSIILSRNDVRTIPVTIWLLKQTPDFFLVFSWVILTSYVVPDDIKFVVDKITTDPEQRQLTNLPVPRETLQLVVEMIEMYADTHSLNDFSTQGISHATARHVLFFIQSYLYAILVDPRPHAQLFGFTHDTFSNFVKGLVSFGDTTFFDLESISGDSASTFGVTSIFTILKTIGDYLQWYMTGDPSKTNYISRYTPRSQFNLLVGMESMQPVVKSFSSFPSLAPREYWSGFSFETGKHRLSKHDDPTNYSLFDELDFQS